MTYQLDDGPHTVVCTDCGATPALDFAVPITPGPHTLTVTATDEMGAVSSVSGALGADTQPPVIFCPGPVTVTADAPCGTDVNFNLPVHDNCDSAVVVVCTPPSGATFGLGLTTVRCLATDDSGNTNGCAFTVRVQDTTRPTIICPLNIIAAELPHDGGSAVVTFALPIATDICDNSLALSCVPPSGTAFPIGYTTVTCQARDDSGKTWWQSPCIYASAHCYR